MFVAEAKQKKPANVHSGHRLRVKERFFKEGLDHFEPHQVLEMLLFFGIPMKDTNELAHTLLDTFGSLYKVFEASFEDLKQVKGVTDHVACLICFCGQLAKRYWVDRCGVGEILDTSQKIGEYVKYRFVGEQNEAVYLVSMDNRRKLLNCTKIASGSVNSADINIRNAIRQALKDNATVVALAHNHPNGHACPSSADVRTTEMFSRALAVADIHLVDHIVVAEDDFVSMAQSKNWKPLFDPRYAFSDDLAEKRN